MHPLYVPMRSMEPSRSGCLIVIRADSDKLDSDYRAAAAILTTGQLLILTPVGSSGLPGLAKTSPLEAIDMAASGVTASHRFWQGGAW